MVVLHMINIDMSAPKQKPKETVVEGILFLEIVL